MCIPATSSPRLCAQFGASPRLIEDSQDGFVCSSGFVVLRPKSVPPEVLVTYLRLPVFCELMDLHTSASMYPAISEKDLLGLPFAPPGDPAETAICDAVARARDARRHATELLETAKRAVEIAIEQGEQAALRFLDAGRSWGMPHLPESARLWLERAEIDYIGPIVKAWAAFNAWDREASGARRVRKDRTAGCEKVVGIRFALDSSLEEGGFELSVPGGK
jgi:hypothetical protein